MMTAYFHLDEHGISKAIYKDKDLEKRPEPLVVIELQNEKFSPELCVFLTEDQAYVLLDQLGIALTDDYKSLDHYVRLQEKEVANELQCPVCDEWSTMKDFDY